LCCEQGKDETADEYKEGDHIAKYNEEELAKFQEIAEDPNVYGILVDSVAPSIWEMDDIKKGILCLLFGEFAH
jgi:DNA replication licensing factor MCM4